MTWVDDFELVDADNQVNFHFQPVEVKYEEKKKKIYKQKFKSSSIRNYEISLPPDFFVWNVDNHKDKYNFFDISSLFTDTIFDFFVIQSSPSH